MKTIYKTIMIAVFLFFCTNWLQAQKTTTKLDQLKLAKVFFVGYWQGNIGKDTVDAMDCQQYGNAFVINVYRVIKGNKSFSYIMNFGFSTYEEKFKGFTLYQSGIYMTWIGSFTSEKKFSGDFVRNFNPGEVVAKVEMIFETPTNMTVKNFNLDNVKIGEYKWSKVQ
jgi:hypothetical protein